MRAVFETLGMQDVVAKSIGSSNPYNMVRADLRCAEGPGLAALGCAAAHIKVSTLQARRTGVDSEAAAD
jgi:small subunit ribosomal protein S5